MKVRDFIWKLSDLVLILDEGGRDWAKSSRMRSAWHVFFLTFVATICVNMLVSTTPISRYLENIENGVVVFRLFMAIAFVVDIILLFRLTVRYFSYTIEGARPIRLSNVGFFYGAGIILFGMLYYFVFMAHPSLFEYDSAQMVWYDSIGVITQASWKTRGLFQLYSALSSVNSGLVFVKSKSILVSVLNYTQTLYTFCLVALLIAGYVNQKTNRKVN